MATSSPKGDCSTEASLGALPAELLVKIAEFCSADQLTNLRQVSRALEQTTYECWRRCCPRAITVKVTKEQIDRHLRVLGMNPTIGHNVIHLHLILPPLPPQGSISSTTRCVMRLAGILQRLPNIWSLTVESWNDFLSKNRLRASSWQPLPCFDTLCRLLSRYSFEYIWLYRGLFFGVDLRTLLSTLNPGSLYMQECYFTEIANGQSSSHTRILPPGAKLASSPGVRFRLTVTGSSGRRDMRSTYLDRFPHGRFQGTMEFDDARGLRSYTVGASTDLRYRYETPIHVVEGKIAID